MDFMKDLIIRRAVEADLPAINRLLVQVHRIHSESRPDLFRPNRPGFSSDAFAEMLADGSHLIVLNVWADNTAALRFYERIGMKVQKIGMETIL